MELQISDYKPNAKFMKMIELFSGMGDISKSFIDEGGESYRVDWSSKIEAELHQDVSKMTVEDVISLCNGIPDVVWASPQCTTYSIATHCHRTLIEGLVPKTELAKHDDKVNIHLWNLIDQLLALGTRYYFVENPRGRMRHMPFVKDRTRYTLTYCSYGKKGNANGYTEQYIMKPTDIWTNYPNPQFLPPCNTKNPPHLHGYWGKAQKRDYLSRGQMPRELTSHIANLLIKKDPAHEEQGQDHQVR